MLVVLVSPSAALRARPASLVHRHPPFLSSIRDPGAPPHRIRMGARGVGERPVATAARAGAPRRSPVRLLNRLSGELAWPQAARKHVRESPSDQGLGRPALTWNQRVAGFASALPLMHAREARDGRSVSVRGKVRCLEAAPPPQGVPTALPTGPRARARETSHIMRGLFPHDFPTSREARNWVSVAHRGGRSPTSSPCGRESASYQHTVCRCPFTQTLRHCRVPFGAFGATGLPGTVASDPAGTGACTTLLTVVRGASVP